jgi:hypothetical protein
MELEEVGRGLFGVVYRHLLSGTEEKHENLVKIAGVSAEIRTDSCLIQV